MNSNLNSSLRNKPVPAFKIEEGYAVRDAAGNDIGTVLTFRFSDDDPRTSVAEAATPTTPDSGRPVSILESVVDVFADDTDMPQELRESLLQHGFIRIRRGALMSDVFATIDQVARVADEVVYLNVRKEALVAR
jgi:hypothetical protein